MSAAPELRRSRFLFGELFLFGFLMPNSLVIFPIPTVQSVQKCLKNHERSADLPKVLAVLYLSQINRNRIDCTIIRRREKVYE